jgi:flagellin-like protein
MNRQDRAATPVVSTILIVAIVVILAATVSVFFLGVTEDINEPAPNVADTTGEFEVGSADSDNQVVQITHIAGDNVNVKNIEIIVRASGPGDDLPTGVRLIDLPGDGSFPRALANENIRGLDSQSDSDFIDQLGNGPFAGDYDGDQIIVVDDSDTWGAGDTIQFSVSAGDGGADFRDPPTNPEREANELEVIILHKPSNSILSEHTFTP